MVSTSPEAYPEPARLMETLVTTPPLVTMSRVRPVPLLVEDEVAMLLPFT